MNQDQQNFNYQTPTDDPSTARCQNLSIRTIVLCSFSWLGRKGFDEWQMFQTVVLTHDIELLHGISFPIWLNVLNTVGTENSNPISLILNTPLSYCMLPRPKYVYINQRTMISRGCSIYFLFARWGWYIFLHDWWFVRANVWQFPSSRELMRLRW